MAYSSHSAEILMGSTWHTVRIVKTPFEYAMTMPTLCDEYAYTMPTLYQVAFSDGSKGSRSSKSLSIETWNYEP